MLSNISGRTDCIFCALTVLSMSLFLIIYYFVCFLITTGKINIFCKRTSSLHRNTFSFVGEMTNSNTTLGITGNILAHINPGPSQAQVNM